MVVIGMHGHTGSSSCSLCHISASVHLGEHLGIIGSKTVPGSGGGLGRALEGPGSPLAHASSRKAGTALTLLPDKLGVLLLLGDMGCPRG